MNERAVGRSPAVRQAAVVVAVCAVGVWALWRVFVTTVPGQRVDELAFIGALHGRTTLWRYGEQVLEPVSVGYVVVVLLATMGIAAARRRWRMAVQVAVLMGGATASTQVLKYLVFSRPHLGSWPHYGNTLPSGHTTAAAAASACLLFVVGPRLRPPVAVLGALYTVATGWSTLVGQWHRPSDVVAAVLVVTAWFAVACVLMVVAPDTVSTATTALPAVRGRGGTGLVLGGLVVVAAVAAVVTGVALGGLWTGSGVPATRGQLVAYGGGVAAIVAASALGFAVQLALRSLAGGAVGRSGGPPAAGRAARAVGPVR